MLFTTKKDKEHSIVFPMLSRLLIDIHPSIFTSLYISLSFLQEIVLLFKYWGSISRAFLHFYKWMEGIMNFDESWTIQSVNHHQPSHYLIGLVFDV